MRRRGDEAQLTQVIQAVSAVDGDFALAFVRLVLEVARSELDSARAKELLKAGLPSDMSCWAEYHLADEDGSLGRVDLRFDADDFTLLVENKLHSGYGGEQLERYVRATQALESGRTGLVAVTRNLPAYGEETLSAEPLWIGSVRWAQLLRAGLEELPVSDSALRRQWQALLEVMKEDGDLGSMEADGDLIRSWARYRDARAHLGDLLDQVRETALQHLRAQLKKSHRTSISQDGIAGPYATGAKGQKVIYHEQLATYVGYRVPAVVDNWTVAFGFEAYDADPIFWVKVEPWKASDRLLAGDSQLKKAIETLEVAGFEREGRGWVQWWDSEDYIDAADVPVRPTELCAEAIDVIAESRVLRFDIEATASKSRRGPKRLQR